MSDPALQDPSQHGVGAAGELSQAWFSLWILLVESVSPFPQWGELDTFEPSRCLTRQGPGHLQADGDSQGKSAEPPTSHGRSERFYSSSPRRPELQCVCPCGAECRLSREHSPVQRRSRNGFEKWHVPSVQVRTEPGNVWPNTGRPGCHGHRGNGQDADIEETGRGGSPSTNAPVPRDRNESRVRAERYALCNLAARLDPGSVTGLSALV